MASPPKAITNAKRNEEVRPFEKNGGFEKHYDDAIKYVVVVDVLQLVSSASSIDWA
jgi:hypothetical protein